MNVGTRGLFRIGRNGRLVEGTVTAVSKGGFTKLDYEWHESAEVVLVEEIPAPPPVPFEPIALPAMPTAETLDRLTKAIDKATQAAGAIVKLLSQPATHGEKRQRTGAVQDAGATAAPSPKAEVVASETEPAKAGAPSTEAAATTG